MSLHSHVDIVVVAILIEFDIQTQAHLIVFNGVLNGISG